MSVKINGNGAAANAFIEKVESLSNQDLLACYQCGKCSAGCPMAKYMDILPHQIIRFAQLGLKDELLASEAIWMCVSCLTCNTRCPKGVHIAEVIEASAAGSSAHKAQRSSACAGTAREGTGDTAAHRHHRQHAEGHFVSRSDRKCPQTENGSLLRAASPDELGSEVLFQRRIDASDVVVDAKRHSVSSEIAIESDELNRDGG